MESVVLKGRRVLIEIPEKKESMIKLSEEQEKALELEMLKSWERLPVVAVGDKCESGIKVGDLVKVDTTSPGSIVDIDEKKYLLIDEYGIIWIWKYYKNYRL